MEGLTKKVLPELPFCTSATKKQTEISNAEWGLGMLPHPRVIH